MDLSHKHIEELFYKQIKDLTLKKKMGSFDIQFSDRWLKRWLKMFFKRNYLEWKEFLAENGLIDYE